ncbi:hypothetical protein K7432_013110 [Basidiobolus ranarum]|uniref:Uncharacterized protein n=1 Tax=Basidiobolus ranarum TaxID=34480 RepID=A0ABR2WJR0_9FUNG
MKTNLEPILLTGLRFFEVEQNQIVTTRPLDLKVKACITLENFPISLLSGNRYRVYPSSEQESTVRFLTKAFSSGYSGILTSVVDNNSENLDPFSNVSRDIFRKGPENLYDCHLIIYNKNPESEEISLLCSVLSDPSMFHNIYHPAVRPRTIQFDKKTTIIPPKENQILDGIPPLSSVDLIDIPPIQLSVPEEDYIARIGENKPNLGVKLPAIMKMNNLRRHRTLGPPMKQKPRLEPIVFYEVDNKKVGLYALYHTPAS